MPKAATKVKGPAGAYIMYSNAVRAEILKANPGLKVTEVAVAIGAKWKALGEAEKAKWTQKAAEAKEAHVAEHGKPEKKSKGSSGGGGGEKKEKDPNAPKRPTTSYIFYMKEKRDSVVAENPSATLGEVGKTVGAMWSALSAAEKKPYEELAAKDKKRYEAETKAYKPKA